MVARTLCLPPRARRRSTSNKRSRRQTCEHLQMHRPARRAGRPQTGALPPRLSPGGPAPRTSTSCRRSGWTCAPCGGRWHPPPAPGGPRQRPRPPTTSELLEKDDSAFISIMAPSCARRPRVGRVVPHAPRRPARPGSLESWWVGRRCEGRFAAAFAVASGGAAFVVVTARPLASSALLRLVGGVAVVVFVPPVAAGGAAALIERLSVP
ncbi:unnamed protein product [Prorocentrum cordatum]|uniref:Uncharacterized protein n=1 Tax=Prorocentrum cordatum TaxID=2364126 RepID=A0ABN9QVE6_9DINO|nr:unnamed protein product [Polarella glacialis]